MARRSVEASLRGATSSRVRAGSSYLSMDSIDVEFGVGTATVVDEIRISWPSGRRQVLRDVEVDQVLVVEEPEG